MIQTLIPLDSPDEWSRALDGIPHSFTHTWNHCYAMHLTTGYPTYLYAVRRGDTRIVCPIAERPAGKYTEAVTPWGFSGFTGNGEIHGFTAIWQAFLRSRGYITAFITLNPLFQHQGYSDPQLTREYNTLHFVDLTRSKEEIFDSFSRMRKRALRKWSESDMRTVRDRDVLASFFLEHYEAFFREHGFPKAHLFSRPSLAHLISLREVYLVGAGTREGLQGVLFGWYSAYSAECIFSVRRPNGPPTLGGLYWAAAKHYKSLGIPNMNLGGELDLHEGIANFKRHFGTYTLPLSAQRQVIRPDIFQELCQQAGCAAESEGYFPPYQKELAGGALHVREDG